MNRIILLLFIVASFCSCSTSLKVMQNSDPTLDIAKSKTYSYNGWFGEKDDLIEVDVKAWEKAFVAELGKRGMTYQVTGGDVIITLMSVVSKESTTNRYNRYYGSGTYGFYQPTWGWGMGYGYGNQNSGYAGVPYKENVYLHGTIICDVFDSKTKKLAWQGVASKALNPKVNKNRGSKIPSIAEKMLKKFPVPIQE